MELRLNKKDLYQKYQDGPHYAPEFDWLIPKAKEEVRSHGVGIFCWESGDTEYRIFPPKSHLSHHSINAATLPRCAQ